MDQWLALSDMPDPMRVASSGLLARGSLVMELTLPLPGPTVLLDYRRDDRWARAFSIFADPAGGIRVLHRQGAQTLRHSLQGPLPAEAATARLTFSWNAPARQWALSLDLLDSPARLLARGHDPLPVPAEDMAAICAGGGVSRRHGAVQWFGFTAGAALPTRAPWVGLRTPIRTPDGWQPAASLVPGDVVLTLDQGPQPLTRADQVVLPARGSFAPVLLRAPYFSDEQDMLVSADQMIHLSGSEVEYLFGEDDVLAEARHLTDGRSALIDPRRSQITGVVLGLERPGLVRTTGCALGILHASDPARKLPCRLLHAYESTPLLSLLGRGVSFRFA